MVYGYVYKKISTIEQQRLKVKNLRRISSVVRISTPQRHIQTMTKGFESKIHRPIFYGSLEAYFTAENPRRGQFRR